MKRRTWTAAVAAASVIVLGGCTDSIDPAAEPSPSVSPNEQATGETPELVGTPTRPEAASGDDSFTADEAQAMLDESIAELRSTGAVQITSRSRGGTKLSAATWDSSTKWRIRQDAWSSRRDYVAQADGMQFKGSSQEIVVEGRRFVSWMVPRNSSPEWLDVTKATSGPFGPSALPLSELEAVTATSASTVGKWTTVIGTVPNEVALTAFGLADSSQTMGVSERMNEGVTRVFVQLSRQAPVLLSMRGVDTSTPGAELPPTFLNDLRGSFYEARYEPTVIEKRITVPTRYEVSTEDGHPPP